MEDNVEYICFLCAFDNGMIALLCDSRMNYYHFRLFVGMKEGKVDVRGDNEAFHHMAEIRAPFKRIGRSILRRNQYISIFLPVAIRTLLDESEGWEGGPL
jgi:hypothetical protein